METSKPIQAVIFDMDGVLSDSEPIYQDSLNQVLSEHGYALTDEDNAQILGTTVEYSWRWIIDRFGLEGSLEDWVARYDSIIVDNLRRRVEASPGVYELLDGVKARGLKLGLASSSQGNWVEALLTTLGVQDKFETIVSGEMVTNGKPDPEIFLTAARRLGVDPARCLVIEDSPHGISAGKSAGMKVVAVVTPLTRDLDLSEADIRIDSLLAFDYSLLDGG